METPVVKTKRGISPIWILPLVALLLGGWLLYRDYQESGVMITVQIKDANGLSPEKTKVMFKGLPVGTLKSFSVSPDLQSINASIEMVRQARDKLTSDTKFWVVRPKVSVDKITGLETLVRGSYFEIQPGVTRGRSHFFIALKDAPPISERVPGLHLTLSSNHDVSLSKGSPVYFKKVEVGEIVSNVLQENGSIETKILIYPRYQRLVTSKTLFYINSGIRLDANLPKVTLQIDPLKTILSGGISFLTPEGGEVIEQMPSSPLPLYRDRLAAENADNIQIKLTFTADHGLERGSEIRYNGVKIGAITELKLDKDLITVHARASIHKTLGKLLNSNSYIWAVKAQVNASGISNLGALVSGSYLNLLPGTGKEEREFQVHSSRPVNMMVNSGLNLVLETDRLGSLGYDKPIYYRQVQVGHTTGFELSPTGQNVLVYINIHPRYVGLVRENTKFWNNGGMRIKGGLLSGIQISTESLASVLSGGISFSTPNKKDMGNRVANGRHFALHSEPDDDWLNWSPALELGNVPEKLLKSSFKY
ncbi:MAG: MlaD family protein [Thermodesulfobacteriota bacterium]